jgi:hypothetical protein
VAGRTLLFVDQAALTDQGVLLNFREHREDAGVDRDLGLHLGGDRQEAAEFEEEPLHNSSNSEHLRFQERTVFSYTYGA